MPTERDLARRWHNRLTTGDPRVDPPAPQTVTPQTPTELPDRATQLLSAYEDAVHASASHNLAPSGLSQHDENAHLIEGRRLHAEVRRLRVEVLALLDVALTDEVPQTDL